VRGVEHADARELQGRDEQVRGELADVRGRHDRLARAIRLGVGACLKQWFRVRE
jgi:hypothetical protein